jgi:hypothetical protein
MRKVSQQSVPWDLREGHIRRQQRRELKKAVAPILARNPRWLCTEPPMSLHLTCRGQEWIAIGGEVVYQERLVGLLA